MNKGTVVAGGWVLPVVETGLVAGHVEVHARLEDPDREGVFELRHGDSVRVHDGVGRVVGIFPWGGENDRRQVVKGAPLTMTLWMPVQGEEPLPEPADFSLAADRLVCEIEGALPWL